MNMKKALKLYQDRGDQEMAALTAERLDADLKSLKECRLDPIRYPSVFCQLEEYHPFPPNISVSHL